MTSTRIVFPHSGQAASIRATVYARLRHLSYRRIWWRGPIRHKQRGITVTVRPGVAYVDFPDEAAADEARRLAALKRISGVPVPVTVRDVVLAVHMQEGRKTAGLPPRP